MSNILRIVSDGLACGVKPASGWAAEPGDRVEIMLPAYHGSTGTVIRVGEIFGFGPSCVVKIDDSTEVVKLPCGSVKVISRKSEQITSNTSPKRVERKTPVRS